MKLNLFFSFLLFSLLGFSQNNTFSEEHLSVSPYIDGTLLRPEINPNKSLAIIIAGSGPTDRDGNQNFLKNDALKKLAVGLTNNGIATFRYDKRIVKQIRQRNVDKNIMFDDFVTDAKACIAYFKRSKLFNKIYIIGHSQGSLVGMIASINEVSGFISLAGAGQSIDKVLIEQISNTAPMYIEETKAVIKSLKSGKITDNYPQALVSVFSKDIQPFMMNWMQYDPQEIISKLQIPVLIINGTKDLQVSIEEAKLLHESALKSELKIIDNMNHVLVPIKGDSLENSKSYNEAYRKLSPELISTITTFINNP